jgi:hypothetical protein
VKIDTHWADHNAIYWAIVHESSKLSLTISVGFTGLVAAATTTRAGGHQPLCHAIGSSEFARAETVE